MHADIRFKTSRNVVWGVLLWVLCGFGFADAQTPKTDLTSTSLEDLMNIEVVSASKKEEKLFDTAAAIFVITQEDIRRSGMTSLPELLRLAPGLQVARIDGNRWAITSRGFSGRYNNKMLVLIDGRTVNGGPLLLWETLDLVLEDIERIEIIRGPGGTLWGANAQNGVINFITKKARNTQGGLQTAQIGTEENGVGLIRFGAGIGADAQYRMYAKYLNRAAAVDALGNDLRTRYRGLRGGGRIDWQMAPRDALTVQGDIFNVGLRENPTMPFPFEPYAPPMNTNAEYDGGNLLARWSRTSSPDSGFTLKAFVDRLRQATSITANRYDTYDVDFQHRTVRNRHAIIWGLGYRRVSDQSNSNPGTPIQFFPRGESIQLFSGFVQDEMTLVKDRLRLILGSKFERNEFSGFDGQPNLRLAWTPGRQQAVWGAISRAIRTQSRYERGSQINFQVFPEQAGLPVIAALIGNPDARSEVLYSYEVGYRVQPAARLSIDATAYYNSYRQLNSYLGGQPTLVTAPRPYLLFPLLIANRMNGRTYGFEGIANLDLTHRWRLQSSYTYGRLIVRDKSDVEVSPIQREMENNLSGSVPRHQFQAHSFLRLPWNCEFDNGLYFVSSLPFQRIPSYLRLDARFGWRIRDGVEWSMGGQNLLDNRHPEFKGIDAALVPGEVRRSLYGKLTWRF